MKPYPEDFPMTEINELIAIIPTGNLLDPIAVNGYWVLLGYGLGQVHPVGPVPAPKPLFAKSAGDVTSEEFVASLESLKAQSTSETLVAQGKVPWGKIIGFIIKILPLFLAEEQG